MLTVETFLTGRQVVRHSNAPEAPRVSVIFALMKTDRRDPLPEATIRSILAGSYTNLELLVVDDGPETLDPIHSNPDALLLDPRVALIRHPRCSDLPALRINEGISLARGKYVIIVSSQVQWRTSALSALIHSAELFEQSRSDAALIVGKLASRDTALVSPSVPLTILTLLDRNRFLPDTVLIPRAVFDTYGMFDCQIAMKDSYAWDVWLRLVNYLPFIVLDEIIADANVDIEESLALPAHLSLFRTLQAVPRHHKLRPDRWTDYAIDALQADDMPYQPTIARQIYELYLRPYVESHHLQIAAPMTTGDAVSTPHDTTLILDFYESTLDVCLGHYTPLSLDRRSYRPHLEIQDQVEPGWTQRTDAALLVRAVGERTVALAEEAVRSGTPIGYYMDDDLLYVHELGTSVFKNLYLETPEYKRLRELLKIVDAVWVTTEPIARSVRSIQPRVIPHLNSVPAEFLPARPPSRTVKQPFKIGYVGTAYRSEEFGYLWPAFQRIAEEFAGQVSFEFWGVNPARLSELKAPVKVVPFTYSYFEYLKRLQAAQFDILLVPLLEFPRARLGKSVIKYGETAVAGALGIFSDVVPYEALADQKTCLKARNTVANWYATLRHALSLPPDEFDRMRAACLEDVRQNYTNTAQIDQHETAWRATEFHALTRTARYGDGRPRILFVVGDSTDIDTAALEAMLRHIRRYAIEPVVMGGDNSAAQLGSFHLEDIQIVAVTESGAASLDAALTLLRMIKPALVHFVSPSDLIEEACRLLTVPTISEVTFAQFDGSASAVNTLLKEYTASLPRPVPAVPVKQTLPGQAVCITGMHRSGTSMITRLMSLCGVSLGPVDQISIETGGIDNWEGLWEHIALRRINDELLALLGGTWSAPPTMEMGWSRDARFDALRQRASQVLQTLSVDGLWGWKDPRLCLTAEFWQGILSQMKVVVCLRDPDEVAASLENRRTYGYEAYSTSHEQGQALWSCYYDSLLDTLRPDQYIVTHYAAYFHDPEAELRRVLKFLGVSVSHRVLRNAVQTISTALKHQNASSQRRLPDALEIRYALLTEKAGPIFRNVPQPRPIVQVAAFVEPADAASLSAVQILGARLRMMARAASRLDAVEHRARLRVWLIPYQSQRLRGYFLVTSAVRSLRREGITVSARRVSGWLRGERHSPKKRKP